MCGWRKVAVGLVVLLAPGAAGAVTPGGDLNQDGAVNVLDIQCMSLAFQEQAGGQVPQGEGCTAEPDMDCDSTVTSVDFVFLVAVIMGKTGGPGTPDVDGDGILNYCDDDSDGDGVQDGGDGCPLAPDPGQEDTDDDGLGDACDSDDDGDLDPDVTDCDPLDSGAAHGLVEICDGTDNDCDGQADEGCPADVMIATVTSGLGITQGGAGSVRVVVGQGVAAAGVGIGAVPGQGK